MIELALLAWRFVSGGIVKIIAALFTFFTTKPGIYVGIALLILGAIWYSGQRGYNNGVSVTEAEHKLEDEIALRVAYQHGLEVQQRMDGGLYKIGYEAGHAKGVQEAKTITLTKKVPYYVDVKTDASFQLPCGLLRLHDAAALGEAPEAISLPAGLTDGEACPVKASVLAAVIVENYGLYHVAETQIDGLQKLALQLKSTIENGL